MKLKKMKLANKCSLQQLAGEMPVLGTIDQAAIIGGWGELNISGGKLENVWGGVQFTGDDGSTCFFEGVWCGSGSYIVANNTAYQMLGWIQISDSWIYDDKNPFNIHDFAHEFGHHLQEEEYGFWGYIAGVAMPSVYDMLVNGGYGHKQQPYEQDAYNRGEEYLKNHMKKPEPKK